MVDGFPEISVLQLRVFKKVLAIAHRCEGHAVGLGFFIEGQLVYLHGVPFKYSAESFVPFFGASVAGLDPFIIIENFPFFHILVFHPFQKWHPHSLVFTHNGHNGEKTVLTGVNRGGPGLVAASPPVGSFKVPILGSVFKRHSHRFHAEEALRVGLISDVTEPDGLVELATKYATRIASNAPLSVKAAKQAALMGLDMPLDQGIAFSHLLWGALRDTEDRKEGFQAFAEKRAPEWKGR